MHSIRGSVAGLLMAILFTHSTPCWSQQSEQPVAVPSRIYLASQPDGDAGVFRVPFAFTLIKGEWAITLSRENLDRWPSDLDVSHFSVAASYGLSDWLEPFVRVNVQTRVDGDAVTFSSPNPPEFPFVTTAYQGTATFYRSGTSSVKLGTKLRLLNDQTDRFSLALKAYGQIPTASVSSALGTGAPSAGLSAVLSHRLSCVGILTASGGYSWQRNPAEGAVPGSWEGGLAAVLRPCGRVQWHAEVNGRRFGSEGEFSQRAPVDALTGLYFVLGQSFFVRPGISLNLGSWPSPQSDRLGSRMGFQVAVGYRPPSLGRKALRPQRPPSLPAPIFDPIDAPRTLRPGESANITFRIATPEPFALRWKAELIESPPAGGSLGSTSGNAEPWRQGLQPMATVAIPYRSVGPTRASINITLTDERGVVDARLITIVVK